MTSLVFYCLLFVFNYALIVTIQCQICSQYIIHTFVRLIYLLIRSFLFKSNQLLVFCFYSIIYSIWGLIQSNKENFFADMFFPFWNVEDATGWSAGTDNTYWSIVQARKHPWAYCQGGKVYWCSYILIFDGHNKYKWFSKLLFHLASISLKIKIFENLHTQS